MMPYSTHGGPNTDNFKKEKKNKTEKNTNIVF